MAGDAAVLEAANAEGLSVLDALRTEGSDGKTVSFVLNPYFLKNASALIFLKTIKVGAGVGVKRGSGFVVRKLGPGQWSAPCFVTLTSLQAGLMLGFTQESTLCTSFTLRVIDSLKAGAHPVFGTDLSLQIYPLTEAAEDTSDLFTGSNAVDLAVASVGKGVLVDFSFSGGSIRVDPTKNEAAYGPGTTTASLLDGAIPPPDQLKPLYRRVDEIALLSKS